MSCVWRVACTERRGLADIAVDVVRRPSGARGCHQIGAAVHQRYRARYVWPRCSPAGGGHSDLYMHMYKRETMILREDFRIRGFRGLPAVTQARGCAVPRLGATREVARDEVVSHDRSPPA